MFYCSVDCKLYNFFIIFDCQFSVDLSSYHESEYKLLFDHANKEIYFEDKLYIYSSSLQYFLGLRASLFAKIPQLYITVSFHFLIEARVSDITGGSIEINSYGAGESLIVEQSTLSFQTFVKGEKNYLWVALVLFENKTIHYEKLTMTFTYVVSGDTKTMNIKPEELYDANNYIYHRNNDDFNITIYTKIECDDIEFDSDKRTRVLPKCCNNFGIKLYPHPDKDSRCDKGIFSSILIFFDFLKILDYTEDKYEVCFRNGSLAKIANTTTNDVFCNCTRGYFGDRCQYKSRCSNCMPGECVGGNTCLKCRPGWEGVDCNTRSCEGFQFCQNNSTCIATPANRTCVCSDGSYGDYCEHQMTTTTAITPAIISGYLPRNICSTLYAQRNSGNRYRRRIYTQSSFESYY
ncbi:Neurogenic locus notch protein 3 [Thelohanellus kitauei]|uniref:Neurogenic locus notch protein 3 n=1 Tax=Thelohanellus kitauei TaxID=669202 RepID=A0A0C2J1M3_THEKT|nr:Neurogenic locus notch protein 3 [Thelohanellus kitauei]